MALFGLGLGRGAAVAVGADVRDDVALDGALDVAGAGLVWVAGAGTEPVRPVAAPDGVVATSDDAVVGAVSGAAALPGVVADRDGVLGSGRESAAPEQPPTTAEAISSPIVAAHRFAIRALLPLDITRVWPTPYRTSHEDIVFGAGPGPSR